MAVKVGKKYPATIFRVPQLFFDVPQLFLESQLFWQGPRVQDFQPGSVNAGPWAPASSESDSQLIDLSPPPRPATQLAPYMPSRIQNQASSWFYNSPMLY